MAVLCYYYNLDVYRVMDRMAVLVLLLDGNIYEVVVLTHLNTKFSMPIITTLSLLLTAFVTC